MDISELRLWLRGYLLDDISDNPDQDDEGYRWKNAELDSHLAGAQEEACRRGGLLYTETDTIGQISLSAGTYLYDIDAHFVRVTDFIFDDKPLVRTTIDKLTRTARKWRSATSGTPKQYAVKGRTLAIYPPPDATQAANTAQLAGYHTPLKRLSAANPTPEIEESLHKHLIYYAAKLAFQKRDIDTHDPQAAAEMEREFTMHFGPLLRADAMAQRFEIGEDIVVMAE